MDDSRIIEALRANALPVDHDRLLQLIGDARLVLIGEATHGTHEFYKMRADLTRELIKKRGFNAVAIEGDWPDTHRVHRFLTGDASSDLIPPTLSGISSAFPPGCGATL